MHSTKLENLNMIKYLEVIFDPDLSFVLHCKEKINKAYRVRNVGDHN